MTRACTRGPLRPAGRGPSRGRRTREAYDATGQIRGLFRDEVYRRLPAGGEELIQATELDSNLIVSSLPLLLAGLMANEPSFEGGILYHAIGEGVPAWDTTQPATPSFAQSTLLAEHFRKPPDSITYLDELGAPAPGVTSIIQVQTTFDYEDEGANGRFIREQGLFGGTAAADSGLMIDAINHKAIWKDETIRLVRFIQLIF